MAADSHPDAMHVASRDRPLGRLAARHFPKRVREALEEIHASVADGLRDVATHAIKECDQQLFRNAEQARNNTEQARCFESIRLLRQHEAQVIDRLLARVESDLAAAPWAMVARDPAAAHAEGSSPLSLVEEQVLDEELAMQELASRATIRFSEALHLLGQRFAVLVASPALEPEALPIGPERIAAAFGEAIGVAGLPLDHRLLFYRIVERLLLARLGMLYGRINTIFVARRILPNLGLAAARRPGAAQAPAVAPGKPAPESAPADPTGPTAASSSSPTTVRPAGVAPPAPGSAPSESTAWMRSTVAPAAPMTPRQAPPAAAHGPAVPGEPEGEAQGGVGPSLAALGPDIARFPGLAGLLQPVIGFPNIVPAPAPADPAEEMRLVDTLLGLLEERRKALGQRMPPSAAAGVTPQTIQQALSTLQRQRHAIRHATGGRSGIQALREDLLNQLRGFIPAGETPRLGAEEQNAIDLLDMLLDELAKEHQNAPPVRELLSRLEVPLLRIALRDRSFFSSAAHPARRLIDVIAGSARYWIDEQGEDTLLFSRLRAMVDRVLRDYEDDLGVFDDLLEDLNGFLGTLARKSEVAEKRHVETARGRERLELARRSAKTAIANLIEGRDTAAVVRTLLEQTWTDVLALTILKHGNDPAELEHALSVANRLVDALDPRKPALDEPARKRLEEDLSSGLQQVGYHEEDARLIAERLLDADRAGRDGQPVSLTEIAIKLKSKTRLGADVAPPTGTDAGRSAEAGASGAAGPPPLTEDEARIRRHLEQTRFGTWFEFVLPGGRRARRKLAWFSTVSGRCLFVNARGGRADEMTLDDLARRIAAGDVAVVKAEPEGTVERAWKRIAESLRRVIGLTPPRPAPA
jgi:hypothetical protein